jgi:hypothetical protein
MLTHSVTPESTRLDLLLLSASGPSIKSIPGLLLATIAPFLPRVPFTSQRQTLPSSRGETANSVSMPASSSRGLSGRYRATPLASTYSGKDLSRKRGSWSQLIAIGPCRCIYSSYHETRSWGKQGSQFAIIRTRSRSLDWMVTGEAAGGWVSPANLKSRGRSRASRKDESSRHCERQSPLSLAIFRKPRETSCKRVICDGSRTVADWRNQTTAHVTKGSR